MPFTVQDLISDHPKPVVVSHADSAQGALQLMIENDFSQLPVVDHEGKVEGMITSDSIIRALNYFGLTTKEMRVSHAMTAVSRFRPDQDMFELLDRLRDNYAVTVVDGEDKVIGIITSYDTTEYFRRRGEDIMFVEDIETMLKDYVLTAFQNDFGETDVKALGAAVNDITPSAVKLRAPFCQALNRYLRLGGDDHPQINQRNAAQAFSEFFDEKQEMKQFEMLTLNEYIEMFLHRSRWDKYESALGLDADACRNLLKEVRDTRNALAHFRADLTTQQRDELRFCKDWLARHQSEIQEAFAATHEGDNFQNIKAAHPVSTKVEGSAPLADKAFKGVGSWLTKQTDLPIQLIEQETSKESFCTPLAVFLQSQPPEQDRVELTFNDVESIIGGDLPKSARQHRSWWANDSSSHVHSAQWLDAGWRVSTISMTKERVTFSRMKDREQAYISFYGSVLAALREKDEVPVRVASADGRSWVAIAGLAPEGGNQVSFVGCSFARGDHFRVELYIDQGERGEVNKAVFDELYKYRERIEAELRETLSWERLNERHASRVALYRDGAITDGDEELAILKTWAVESITKFYQVFSRELSRVSIAAESRPSRTSVGATTI